MLQSNPFLIPQNITLNLITSEFIFERFFDKTIFEPHLMFQIQGQLPQIRNFDPQPSNEYEHAVGPTMLYD